MTSGEWIIDNAWERIISTLIILFLSSDNFCNKNLKKKDLYSVCVGKACKCAQEKSKDTSYKAKVQVKDTSYKQLMQIKI